MTGLLSIVIPTFNAAASLTPSLAAIERAPAGLVREVIVADAGSTDGTRSLAEAAGARVATAPRGRGPQLATGAEASSGDWLLFLHADTRLDPGWDEPVAGHIADPESKRRAAYFRFSLDDASRPARRLEAMVAWRSRALGLPYGDQGLLISRSLYDAVGGFRPLVLMEDVDIVRRIGRSRLTMLDVRAVTSSVRYRRFGYLARSARNLFCLSLFFAGVPSRWISRVYG